MTVKKQNLLVDNSAAPSAGLQVDNCIAWPGGHLNLIVIGTVFDSGTLDLMVCTKCPPGGTARDSNNNPQLALADFTTLKAGINAAGIVDLGYVNPCIIGLNVNTPGPNMRVKASIF
jgi:hypothetical protein